MHVNAWERERNRERNYWMLFLFTVNYQHHIMLGVMSNSNEVRPESCLSKTIIVFWVQNFQTHTIWNSKVVCSSTLYKWMNRMDRDMDPSRVGQERPWTKSMLKSAYIEPLKSLMYCCAKAKTENSMLTLYLPFLSSTQALLPNIFAFKFHFLHWCV